MNRSYRVSLNGVLVGFLTETNDKRVGLRLADSYLALSRRPVLSQSFEDDPRRADYGRGRGLHPFFANLIPEVGPLRTLLESSLGLEPGDDLALLEAVGRDLPGAVEVTRAETEVEFDSDALVVEQEDSEISQASSAGGLRFSLAGVQMKFSVLREPGRIALPTGEQRGDWIVKLNSPTFPNVVENEFVMMEWARKAGFEVPECALEDSSALTGELRQYASHGTRVFVIKRYDRIHGSRVHQEDFAQVAGLRPALKYDQMRYEQCAFLVSSLMGEDAYFEFVRRLTFMIAAGNADAHLKNWSLIYPDGVHPRLSPLYDQVSTVAWPEVNSELALKFAGTKNWFQVDQGRFAHFATRARADSKQTVATVELTLERLVGAWNDIPLVRSVLPASHLEALSRFWRRVALLKPFASSMTF